MSKLSVRRVRGKDTKQLGKNARRAFDELTAQANSQTSVFGVLDDTIPTGLKGGDVVIQQAGGSFQISMADDAGNLFTIPLREGVSNGLTMIEGTGAPGVSDFPNAGDSGFYRNTSNGDIYLAYNRSGTIQIPTLSAMSGNLPFSRISGSFTNEIHGSLGGGTLHSAVTTSSAGFMSAADKIKLNNYPADCTVTYNDSNAVKRDGAGLIDAAGYMVANQQVIGARKSAVTSVSDTATAVYGTNEQDMLNNLKTAVNAILTRLRVSTGHGLISG